MEWRFKKEKEKRKKKMEKKIAQVPFNQKQISQEKQENDSVLAMGGGGGYGKYSWFEIIATENIQSRTKVLTHLSKNNAFYRRPSVISSNILLVDSQSHLSLF